MFAHVLVVLLLATAPSKTRKPAPECGGGQSPKDVYIKAYLLKDSKHAEAAALFRKVLGCTQPDDEFHQKAKARLEDLATKDGGTAAAPAPELLDCGGGKSQKDLFLQAYVIENSDTPRAIGLYRKVIACSPNETEYSQKAKRKIDELSP